MLTPMNAPILASQWPKARYTVAQIWGLIERGIIRPDAKFELLDGEIIPVSPKGPLHEELRQAVIDWLVANITAPLTWLPETTLYLEEKAFLEPDFVVFDRAIAIRDLRPDQVKLAIEVGHESWRYDTNEKAKRYAKHGVQEYWAIQAKTRMIRVHRGPGEPGWAEVRDAPAGEAISPLCAPHASFALK